MNVPTVSVLIASYNYARYLPRAIESALAQEGVELEVVVSDNCSTDDSVAVARRYESDPRFRLIVRDEPTTAHGNALLELARGTYVIQLNADDFFLPGGIARLVGLAAEPGVDVAYGAYVYADAAGTPYQYNTAGLGPYRDRNEVAALLVHGSQIATGAILFERSWFAELGPGDVAARGHGDLELYLRLASAGKRFAYTPEPIVAIRKHGSNMSSHGALDASGDSFNGWLYCLEKYVVAGNARALRGYDAAFAVRAQHLVRFYERLPVWAEMRDATLARLTAIEQRLAELDAQPVAERAGWPRVSVTMVTDGRRPGLLAQALRSALAQTYRDFEIVVVVEGAFALAPVLRALDPEQRVRCVTQLAAFGRGRARTNAVELARGELVAYLDETDLWEPDHLAHAVAAIDAGAGAVRMRTSRSFITYDVPGDGSVAPAAPQALQSIDSTLPMTLGASPAVPAVSLSSVVHRRRFFDVAMKFDATLPALEDFAFSIRLHRTAGIRALDAATVTARTVLDRATPAWSRNWQGYLASLEAIWTAFPVDPPVQAARRTYRARLDDAASALASGTPESLLRAAMLIELADDLAWAPTEAAWADDPASNPGNTYAAPSVRS